MPVDSVIEYERIWVDGLNRGDASAAGRGVPARLRRPRHRRGPSHSVASVSGRSSLEGGTLGAVRSAGFDASARWRANEAQLNL